MVINERLLQFQNLIELMAQEKKKLAHQLVKEENLKRLAYIEQKKTVTLEKIDQTFQDLSLFKEKFQENEKSLASYSQKLHVAQEHLTHATNQKQLDSLESEIDQFTQTVSSLEDQGLELLEKIETLAQSHDESKSFIAGCAESQLEIQQEVEAENTIEDKSIEAIDIRIQYLFEQCTNEFKESYKQVSGYFKAKKPLTFIKGKACLECYYEIDEFLRDNVDRNFSLEFCPGCTRLICPIAATTVK